MQNLMPSLRQTSIISKKLGFLSEKNKNFDELKLAQSLIFFCWNFAHIFCLVMSTKGCAGFLFCVDLELLMKV